MALALARACSGVSPLSISILGDRRDTLCCLDVPGSLGPLAHTFRLSMNFMNSSLFIFSLSVLCYCVIAGDLDY